MRWVLFALVALAIAVGAMVAIGASLPVAHVASRSRRFARSPEQVAQAIGDPTQGQPDFELVESTPSRIVTRVKPGKPYGGTWTWQIAAEGAGTTVTITERGEVYSALFRFLSRYLFGQTRNLDAALAAVAKKLGEA